MFRSLFCGGQKPQHFGALKSIRQDQIRELRTAFGQRASLVESNHACARQRLKRFTLSKEHTHFRASPGSDHDRGRRRQTHRAGAGDDQHCDAGNQRVGQRRFRADKQPDDHGQRRHAHHGRNEPHRDSIDEPLDRQLGGLSRFDHSNDLRQHRVFANGSRAKRKGAGAIHGPAHHTVALCLLNRDRFTGHHAFVDVALPLLHDTVHRDTFTGPHMHDVAGCKFCDRPLHDLAAALDPSGLGLQPDQPRNGGAGATLGPGFKQPAQKYQCHDHPGGFEIDGARRVRQQRGKESRHGRITPGREGPKRHKAVHVRRASQQRRDANRKEPAAGPDQHERRQDELYRPGRLLPNGAGNPVMKFGDNMTTHFKHEDRKRQ